jgi:hypothetical protein
MGRTTRIFGLTVAFVIGIGSTLLASSPTHADSPTRESLCIEKVFACADTHRHVTYEGDYSGHDEPAVVFNSTQPGSGNQSFYRLTLPRDSVVPPKQDGTGGTWNFQLRPAFWFSMALCDPQSGPEYTHAPCVPNSDTNIFNSADPNAPDWIGHHPGAALLELQFYPPGWVPLPDGTSCTATQWCAAMNIDSYNFSDLTNIDNNKDCLTKVSDEPVNLAMITKSGVAHSPAGPLENGKGTPDAAYTFNPPTDLLMNPGDQITVDIHDTSAGLTTIVHDLTTGQNGSMTASIANGFAQVQYEPNASKCREVPYAFHPMYSTSTPATRVEWTAHSLNVAMSDEIDHFEYCDHVSGNGGCQGGNATDPTKDGQTKVSDDDLCLRADESLLAPVSGCGSSFDTDFDGASYQNDWPGTTSDPSRTSEPLRFSSPTFDGHQYSSVTFQTDVVNLQRHAGVCTPDTLSDCTVPPGGAPFYPMYTTGNSASGGCEWREGGPNIPGATNTFGGSPTAEWGSVVPSFYPTGPASTDIFYENFENALSTNPCPQ